MKTKALIVFASLMAVTALARMIMPFVSWDQVVNSSPCVMIAKCGDPSPSAQNVITINGPKSDSEIVVLAVLKGTNSLGIGRLQTDSDLLKGENYLIFSRSEGTNFEALEEYRVIPIGSNLDTNALAGKPFEEQLQMLFDHRLKILNRQILKESEEKQRLKQFGQK